MNIFETLKEWRKPNPKRPYIKCLRKAGIKDFPTSEELVAFGNKTLLVYPDNLKEVVKSLIKLWGYKGRTTLSLYGKEQENCYMYFSFIKESFHSKYRKENMLKQLLSAEKLTIATDESECTAEVEAFMKEAGVKIVRLLFENRRIRFN